MNRKPEKETNQQPTGSSAKTQNDLQMKNLKSLTFIQQNKTNVTEGRSQEISKKWNTKEWFRVKPLLAIIKTRNTKEQNRKKTMDKYP